MSSILDQIIQVKRKEIAFKRSFVSESELRDKLGKRKFEKASLNFEAKPFLIAEIKRASPSKGIINHSFDHIDLASEYLKAGVDCISILTDQQFFWGTERYLWQIRKELKPRAALLRKDFVISKYQVYESAFLGADLVLLIASALDQDMLQKLYLLSLELGLIPLIEVHDEAEARIAMDYKDALIGVNHRDLRDFSVDLSLTEKVRQVVGSSRKLIAESGITSLEDVRYLLDRGADGFLIGEWFNKVENPGALISKIKALS